MRRLQDRTTTRAFGCSGNDAVREDGEDSKRVAVEAMKLTFGKVGHVLATWPKQPQLPVAVNG